MCVVSMVYDHYGKTFEGIVTGTTAALPQPSLTAAELAELRTLIGEFREAVKAAKLVDKATGQPDCVDPAKAKLEERVAALEKLVDMRRRHNKPKTGRRKR